MSRRELTVEASTDNLARVLAFLDERLEELDCGMKAQMQIDIALEEIFVNVAQYAYAHLAPQDPSEKLVSIQLEDSEDPRSIEITIRDRGIPFDPLAKEDPDTTLSAEERRIGGLGIFMAKKSMDSMHYEYRDGQNILTFRKYI